MSDAGLAHGTGARQARDARGVLHDACRAWHDDGRTRRERAWPGREFARRPLRPYPAAVLSALEIAGVGMAVAAAVRVFAPGRAGLAAALAAGVAAAGAAHLLRPAPPAPDPDLPGPSPRAGYAGSDACRACHPKEHATWYASYHRTMTQAATPDTVRARFDGELSDRGLTFRLETTADGRFLAHLLDRPGGEVRRTLRTVMTTGSHHLQNYWLAEDDGWYAPLPFTWHIRDGRWVPTPDSFLQPDTAGTTPFVTWNDGCVYCHAVGGAGGVSDDGRRAATGVAELGIACEACHGPGAAHVAANRNPVRRYGLHLGAGEDPTTAHPGRLDATRASAVCGRCHGIFLRTDYARLNRESDAFTAGDTLDPTRRLLLPAPHPFRAGRVLVPPAGDPRARVTLADGSAVDAVVRGFDEEGVYFDRVLPGGRGSVDIGGLRLPGTLSTHAGGSHLPLALGDNPGLWQSLADALGWRGQTPSAYDLGGFWGDGTVRSTGREANGLARSACATRGDMTCGSCHAMHGAAAPADLLAPGMDGDRACTQCHADVPADHARHAAVACADCHMPHTTFGLLGAIRAHRVDSPTAEMSTRHGRPNACNLCHLDRTLAWTAEWLERWYRQPPPALSEADRTVSAAVRWLLEGDGAQRAIAAWAFRYGPARRASGEAWAAPLLAALLDDDYAAVRAVAGETLRALPGFADWTFDYVAPPETRRAAAADARRRWATVTPDRTGPAVLVLGPGRADDAAIERMRAGRDVRPIVVSE